MSEVNYSYNIALNMYRNLTGDYDTKFDSTDDIYTAIDAEFDSGDGLFEIESINLTVTENGTYTYDKTFDIDAYVPVNVTVDIKQKYTDEQVVELQSVAFNEGKSEGETIGYQNGYTAGNTDGYSDGYSDGLDDGAAEQKGLLEDITITANGVYEKEDGYSKVTVVTPEFETETLTVELTENGDYSYTPTKDGFGSVNVNVNVAGSGGGSGLDFSVIGWDTTDSNRVNSQYNEDFAYSASVANKLTSSGLYQTFKEDGKLVYAPYGNTNSKTNAYSMFFNCYALREVPLYDTSSATTMQYMFYGCSSLITIPQFNTIKVRDMSYMFNGCKALTTVPNFDTSNVTNMRNMFDSCSSLTTVPNFDTSNVTDMSYMFDSCSKLASIPELDTSKVTNMSNMFNNYSGYVFLKQLGGFKNLGAQSSLSGTNSNFLDKMSYLTKESIMNVINNLYDRKSAGYSTVTLKLGTTNLAKITDSEKAIATNKGWTLS